MSLPAVAPEQEERWVLTALCKSVSSTEEVVFSAAGATDGKAIANVSGLDIGSDTAKPSPRASLAASRVISSIAGNVLGCLDAIVINECIAAGSVDSHSISSSGSSRAAIIAL